MAKINLKQQITLITGAVAVASVIIAILVIIPAVRQILSLEKSIGETQKFLEQQYEKTQKMRRSVHGLEATIEKTEKFNRSLVKEGDELKIITELEKLASNNNIDQTLQVEKVGSISAKKKTPESEKASVLLSTKPYYNFSFSTIGTFENHLNHIRDLEMLPYYLNITSIKLTKKQDADLIAVRFNAKIYIIGE